MTIRIRRRTFLIAALLIALVAGGAIAIAAWSTSASGNAYSKASTASAIVLSSASASTTGDLYPGGSGDLKLKVANPNSFPVRITGVSLTAGGTITSDNPTCDSGGNGVSLTDQSGLSIDLAANAPAAVITMAGAVQMATSSNTNCQGATFTIPVDVTAASH